MILRTNLSGSDFLIAFRTRKFSCCDSIFFLLTIFEMSDKDEITGEEIPSDTLGIRADRIVVDLALVVESTFQRRDGFDFPSQLGEVEQYLLSDLIALEFGLQKTDAVFAGRQSDGGSVAHLGRIVDGSEQQNRIELHVHEAHVGELLLTPGSATAY